MPLWRIGLDEAGYGPNLGPFIMTAVACRVPDEHAATDLWELLAATVRKAKGKADNRIYIDDSKLLYSPSKGLARLEAAVLAILGGSIATLGDLVERVAPSSIKELSREPWYVGDTALSIPPDCEFHGICEKLGVQWGTMHSLIVCPATFNGVTMAFDSKGAVLSSCCTTLLKHCFEECDGDLHFVGDKHGGRNGYSAILHEAFHDGMAIPRAESMNESTYDMMGLGRNVRATFRPRADSGELCVALASMISKLLRERLMEEFNRYWRKHVPDLEPTAGYPLDASRYFAVIEPLLPTLGIERVAIWRER